MKKNLDRTNEAIRDLDSLKNKEDVGLGSMIALVYAHKRFASVDKDSVNELDARIKETRKKVEEKPLYYAGYFWYIVNRPDKAREYIDRALKKNPEFVEVRLFFLMTFVVVVVVVGLILLNKF